MQETPSFVLPLQTKDIEKCIPQRFPFLLIDRVTELVPNQNIIAFKNISLSDPIFQGHFPSEPIYPGVYILEGMTQASCVLGYHSLEEVKGEFLLTEITNTRFRKKVIPGDKLIFEVKRKKGRNHFFWAHGSAIVDGEIVATAQFSALCR